MTIQNDSKSLFSHEWWRVTLSSIGDGVIVTDRFGKIAFMNRIAEELTGWANAGVADLSLNEVLKLRDEANSSELSDLTQKLPESPTSAKLVARDGQEILVDFRGSQIKNDQQENIGLVIVFRDITERSRAEIVDRRLAAIVEGSDDAIVGKTLDSVITSWNHAAEKMFGYSAEEAIGQSIYIIVPPERSYEEEKIISTLRRGERLEHFETIRMTKDGRRLNISLTVSPIKDRFGTVVGASKIARDITEQKRIEAQRERLLEWEQFARARAEDSNRLKDEFLATVSHELRTPLNAILGWATLLAAGKLEPEAANRALETIQRNAHSQAQIINDILDISRIVSGRLRLNLSNVEVSSLVEMVIETVRPAAEGKGIKLSTEIDDTVGDITADLERLQQVVANLLSNAIKFTPSGGTVEVRLERFESEVEIVVRDSGEGISKEFLPHVFDRFRQADSSITRSHGGLGLGLAIVRHLAELHGGRVQAESAGKGKGSTFRVSLPIALSAQATTAKSEKLGAELREAPDLDGLTVLVVDDEQDARHILTAMLEHYGAKVQIAASVSQAVEILEQDRPDILVSDIGMPEMDGYDLIKTVRYRGMQIPAVAVTAHAMSSDRLRALAAGYQVHVAKPVDSEELAIVVASLAGIAKNAKRARFRPQ
jgi:PAS domain S-box-containing protein